MVSASRQAAENLRPAIFPRIYTITQSFIKNYQSPELFRATMIFQDFQGGVDTLWTTYPQKEGEFRISVWYMSSSAPGSID